MGVWGDCDAKNGPDLQLFLISLTHSLPKFYICSWNAPGCGSRSRPHNQTIFKWSASLLVWKNTVEKWFLAFFIIGISNFTLTQTLFRYLPFLIWNWHHQKWWFPPGIDPETPSHTNPLTTHAKPHLWCSDAARPAIPYVYRHR